LYLQLLMAISFVVAGYQDIKDRLVSDIVWIPAVIGVAISFYFLRADWVFLAFEIGLMGVIAFVITWYGFVGQADGIAFILLIAGTIPFGLFPAMIAVAAVVGAAIGYLYLTGQVGKPKVIPLSQFKKEPRWIPKAVIVGDQRSEVEKDVNISRESMEAVTDESAMVEVQYGVPTVAYLAAGYIVYVIFLAIFQTGTLLSLP
jgi:hypothetical protein